MKKNKELEKQEIEKLIKDGFKNKEIAKILDIGYGSVCAKLRQYGLVRYFKPKTSKETVDEMVKLYTMGFNCKEISNKIGLNRMTVSNLLKEADVKVVRRSNKKNLQFRLIKTKKCLICEKEINYHTKLCWTCNSSVRRYKIKKMMFDKKGGKCIDCKSDDLDISCYDFHHTDPSKKEFSLSSTWAEKMSLEEIENELQKCVLLCSNCHRTRHAKNRAEKFWNYLKLIELEL